MQWPKWFGHGAKNMTRRADFLARGSVPKPIDLNSVLRRQTSEKVAYKSGLDNFLECFFYLSTFVLIISVLSENFKRFLKLRVRGKGGGGGCLPGYVGVYQTPCYIVQGHGNWSLPPGVCLCFCLNSVLSIHFDFVWYFYATGRNL